jgi:hypothetical protein
VNSSPIFERRLRWEYARTATTSLHHDYDNPSRLPYAIPTVEKAKQPNDEEKRIIVSQTGIILVTIRSSFPATHELLSPVRRIEKTDSVRHAGR